MKYCIQMIILLLMATPMLAQTKAEKTAVSINGGKFMIEKANVSPSWRYDAVSMALGINDRRRAGVNTTHTYDDLGIVLFEKSDDQGATGILSEVQFYISAGDTNVVSPKKFFKGRLQIEQLKISGSLSWQKVKETLKDYAQSDSYMEHNYRLAYKGIYIYFQFDDDETRLEKVSVGKDMNGK